jgi:hypothetical protein
MKKVLLLACASIVLTMGASAALADDNRYYDSVLQGLAGLAQDLHDNNRYYNNDYYDNGGNKRRYGDISIGTTAATATTCANATGIMADTTTAGMSSHRDRSSEACSARITATSLGPY